MDLTPGTYALLHEDGSFRELFVVTASATVKAGRAKPVTMTAQPSFDPATEKVVQNGWQVNAGDVTPIWQVVALTQAELDEIADQATITQIVATADAMLAGTGTTSQRFARLENALGRLLKRLVKTGKIP